MSFAAVPADAYDRFMGRYSSQLSPQLADYAGVTAGQRVLDVGCGPGALTAELVARVTAANVTAVDPRPRSSKPPAAVTRAWRCCRPPPRRCRLATRRSTPASLSWWCTS